MNYVIVALIFVVLMMLYLGYTFFANREVIKSPVYLPDTEKLKLNKVDWDKMASPAATTYHYEGWLYLKERNTSPDIPVIFYRGDEGYASNTQFILGMDEQSLNIYTSSVVNKGSMKKPGTLVLTIMQDFPLQKWVFFVLNVVNGSIIECYINGKLLQSLQVPPPTAAAGKLIELAPDSRSSLNIGGTSSVHGYITKFKRDPTSLNTDEAWNAYLAGNGLGAYTDITGGYGAVLSLFSKEEGELQKLTIL